MECPRQSEAGLEVIQILFGEVSWGVNDRAQPARQRIPCCRIELRLLSVFGVERRFVGPSHAQFESQVPNRTPCVLHVERMRPPARKPVRRGRCVSPREPRVPRRKAANAFPVFARNGNSVPPNRYAPLGQRLDRGVISRADELVSSLERVAAENLREVLLEREVFRAGVGPSAGTEAVKALPPVFRRSGKVSSLTFGIPSCSAQS